MAIAIEEYRAERTLAATAFNRRVGPATPVRLPERPLSAWLPAGASPGFDEVCYLAVEGREVRGGYRFKRQPFEIAGRRETVCTWYAPVSEGLVDSRYRLVGALLTRDAMARAPLLYSRASDADTWALLDRLKWPRRPMPLYFTVHQAERFLARLPRLRDSGLGVAARALASTGLAGPVFRGLRALRGGRRNGPPATAEVETEFGEWTDRVWALGRGDYSFVAVRDAASMARLMPAGGPPFEKLVLRRGGEPVGWAALLVKQQADHPRYGDLRVGLVADAFAPVGEAPAVLDAAARRLAELGADLTVFNHSHPQWQAACAGLGFFDAPATMALSVNPAVAERLAGTDPRLERTFASRHDGEGEFFYAAPADQPREPAAD